MKGRLGEAAAVWCCALWIAQSFPMVTSARADTFDTVNVRAGVSQVFDSNVFRLSAATDPQTVLGSSSKADQLTVATVGLNVSKPYSLQRFEFDASVTDYRYRSFTFLNFVATNFSGAWRYSVTPRLHGNIVASQTETQASFVDFRSFSRNVRTDRITRADFEYEIDGVFRLIGAVGRTETSAAQAIVQQLDARNDVTEAGVKLAFLSGSYMTAVVRHYDGRNFRLAQPDPVSLSDNRYDQREYEGKLVWLFSGKSYVDTRFGHLERRHPTFGQRDFRGLVGAATFNWGITGKSSLVATFARELNPFLQSSSSYFRQDKLSLGPVWQASAKTLIRARYDLSVRSFFGPVVATPTADREDLFRTLYVGMDWQPYRWVSMSLSLQKDSRASNQAGFDFSSTTATIGAQVTF